MEKKKQNQKIAKRTLELLLRNVKSIEHVNEIDEAIKDYEFEGCDLSEYHEKTKELREGYWN
jgi:hypothetical protein